MQEHTDPALRTQVGAVTHLEPWLDAEEEEVGVPDASEIPHSDLDGRLEGDRENDRGGNGQARLSSIQAHLENRYTGSDANRMKNQPNPERKSRSMFPLV
jgi:hypothetical protein